MHDGVYYHSVPSLPWTDLSSLLSDVDIPLITVGRNPYVRLLSGYLDKRAHGEHYPYWGLDVYLHMRLMLYRADTFECFVRQLYALYGLLGNRLHRVDGVNHHFAQQARFCWYDGGLRYDYMLKLERINEWYDEVIADLELQHHVASQWPGDGDCFFSTPGNGCRGPHVVVDENGGVTFVSPGITPEHNTGAAAMLKEHYTPEAVRLVNLMYEDDFRLFGYSMWDGRGEPRLD